MEYLPKPENMLLTHWTYSREEWKAFMRWKKKKNGLLYTIKHSLLSVFFQKIPEVKITPGTISFGGLRHHFRDDGHQVQRIDLSDEGEINILAISFERLNWGRGVPADIRIPVPKGRLREAIEVQERLLNIEY
jgi:hypothetical protein